MAELILRTNKEEEEEERKEKEGNAILTYTPHHAESPDPDRPLPERIIEEIGMGRFQWRVFAICGLFFFADVMEVMFLTYLKMAWKADKSVSSWWSAAIGTSVFGGMLVGATFWGIIADRYGRKFGLACVSVLISLFGLGSVFSPNVQVLVVLRACVGFGLGGSHIAVTLLSEVVPVPRRAGILSLFQSFMFLAVWTEAGMAWAFMESLKWRWMAFFTCVPSFLSVAFIYWLPESPLWLTVTKKPQKAAQILQTMAAFNKSNVYIDEERLASLSDAEPSSIDQHKAGDVKQLFSKYLYKSTILIWLVWWGNSMVYYGLMLITPDYLAESGTGNVYRDIFITVLAECPALILVAVLVKTVGAATAQGIYFLGSGSLIVVIATVKKLDNKFVAILMSLLIRFFTAGSFYCTYTLTPAIYPTTVRSIGFGAGSSMSRVGGMVTPFIANIADPTQPNGLLIPCLVYGGTALVCMIAGFLLNLTTRAKPDGRESAPLISSGNRKYV